MFDVDILQYIQIIIHKLLKLSFIYLVNKQTNMLISTKLNIPTVNKKMVSRKTLINKLTSGREKPLMIVTGPAGSGKTSLVCQWIMEDEQSIAWYSLDENDNDPDLFFQYFINALGSVSSRLKSEIDPWIKSENILSYPDFFPILIEHLTNLREDIYLVLDDYHLIKNDGIHDRLLYLIKNMPKNTHIIIISRYSIPFSIPQFRVKNQITEITATDLRFSEKETKQFLTEIIPGKISIEQGNDIVNMTEGWVGGLQLLALSTKEIVVKEDFEKLLFRIDLQTSEYLIEEVINVQPEDLKTFIYYTALLDRFNADLAKEITGLQEASELLFQAYRDNLFLIPLDTAHEWYRYHNMLSEAVRKHVKRNMPDVLKDIYKKAAIWFAQNKYLEDAFRNAFASEDLEFAADLMEDYMLYIIDRTEFASGHRWLSKLPYDLFKQRPLLMLHECGQKIESLLLNEVEGYLNEIESNREGLDRYNGNKKKLCSDQFIYFHNAIKYYYRKPFNADIDKLEQASGMISSENRVFAGYLKTLIVYSCILKGNLVLAEKALKDASPSIFSSNILFAKILWYRVSSSVKRMKGDIYKSERVLKAAFEFIEQEELTDTPLKYILYLPLAWNYYYRNDIDKALEYTGKVVQYSELVNLKRDYIEGNLIQALIYQSTGAMEDLETCIQKVGRLPRDIYITGMDISSDPWLARIKLACGDMDHCLQWSDKRKLSPEEPFSLIFLYECMTQAELFFKQGLYQKAIALLEPTRKRCMDNNMLEALLEIDIAISANMYAAGEHDTAKSVIKRTLSFAETKGYIMPFVKYASTILPLLSDTEWFSPISKKSSFLKSVLTACGSEIQERIIPDKLKKNGERGLTQREIEILKFMAKGYQYKEIADKACISFETVKTHVKHIYEKLGVSSKLHAIRKAQDLRLLNGG